LPGRATSGLGVAALDPPPAGSPAVVRPAPVVGPPAVDTVTGTAVSIVGPTTTSASVVRAPRPRLSRCHGPILPERSRVQRIEGAGRVPDLLPEPPASPGFHR